MKSVGNALIISGLSIFFLVGVNLFLFHAKAAQKYKKCAEVDLTISGVNTSYTSGWGSTSWKVNGVVCEKEGE